MNVDLFLYRVHRLRRLIILAALPPMIVVLLIWLFAPGLAWALLPFAVLCPMAHAVFYPNMQDETLAVSLTLTVVFALIGLIAPSIGWISAFFGLIALLFVAFLMFMFFSLYPVLSFIRGDRETPVLKARAKSKLPLEDLRKAITFYPGRHDRFVDCGAPNSDGAFPVQMRVFAPSGSDEDTTEVELEAVITEQGPDVHEIESGVAGEDDFSIVRHEFKERRKGTLVIMEERPMVLPKSQYFGMWLTDYMADYLTAEIERAEESPPRANRSFPPKMMIGDIAKLFKQDRPHEL